ncbi:hypothetical protein DAI22_05g164501 [Oryza sativa Japonica Group]|nr:hypothetical protein DAI22_05g164501 [Oryza sativa Japonica Group]
MHGTWYPYIVIYHSIFTSYCIPHASLGGGGYLSCLPHNIHWSIFITHCLPRKLLVGLPPTLMLALQHLLIYFHNSLYTSLFASWVFSPTLSMSAIHRYVLTLRCIPNMSTSEHPLRSFLCTEHGILTSSFIILSSPPIASPMRR